MPRPYRSRPAGGPMVARAGGAPGGTANTGGMTQTKEQGRTRRRANELDGRTWTRYSISVWSDIRKNEAEIKLGHPAIFPVQLVGRLIQCFAPPGEVVILDPFAGSGSTLVGAVGLGKEAIGLELIPEYVELARRRLVSEAGALTGRARIYQADARELLRFVEPNSVDLVITSPPYWNVLSRKRTSDGKAIRDYVENPADLSRIPGYQEFIQTLALVFRDVYTVLRPGRYCLVVVMDLRQRSRFFPFHADLASALQGIGYVFDDLIIWDRRQEYNHLRPLGYPSVFRINKVHEYILIFRKPG